MKIVFNICFQCVTIDFIYIGNFILLIFYFDLGGFVLFFCRKYGRRKKSDSKTEFAVRQSQNKSMGAAECVPVAGRRQGVLRVV